MIKYGNIDPSKTLYRHIGKGSSHDLNEAIAEYIDNSIEAMTDEQKAGSEKLTIEITIGPSEIVVRDNAKGMEGSEAVSSLKLAQTKKSGEELGQFGVGLKTSTLHIADTLTIISGKKGSKESNRVRFNIQEWESDKTLGFGKPYPYTVDDTKPINAHGTFLKITDLHYKITDNKIERLKASLGNRYRSFIKTGILIVVNKRPVHPGIVVWDKKFKPKGFSIDTEFGKITGTIGLMKKSSQIGNWGFDLFRNGRLIAEEQKFGISGHPGHAYVRGEINLDFVPVNQDKNKFLSDSPEYEAALKACTESELFKQYAKASNSKRGVKEERTFMRNADAVIEALAEVFRHRNRIEEIPVPRTGVAELPTKTMITEVVEEREQNGEGAGREQHDPTNTQTRHPKHTHKVIRYKTREGKTLNIKYETYRDEEDSTSKIYRIENDTIYVSVNTGFAAYDVTSDKMYYVADMIVDSISDIHAQDAGIPLRGRAAYKDGILKDVFDIIEKQNR